MTAPTLGEHQLPISAQDVPYRAEDRTLFASSPAGLRSGGNDAARHTAQRQRLKPDAAGPAKRGEEESFTAKQSGLDPADVFNIVFDGGLKRDEASCIDAKHFAWRERPFDQHAAGVHECPAVAVEAFHDEAFTAKEANADALLKSNSDAHAFRRGEERIFLGDQLAANIGEPDRHDLPRIRRGKRDSLLGVARIHKDGHEQRLTNEKPFSRPDERIDEAPLLGGAIAEYSFHADDVFHVKHPAGLGDGGLTGIQLHFDELHVVAKNFVIDFVHCAHAALPPPRILPHRLLCCILSTHEANHNPRLFSDHAGNGHLLDRAAIRWDLRAGHGYDAREPGSG